jgi:hypothetical protein
VVARGLAILRMPVCPLIKEHLPDEWATYVAKTAPAIEPGTFGLGRKLAQQEARLRLLQLMSEGTDGACLAFVTEEAGSQSVSPEERRLAQTILRPSKVPSAEVPSLAELDRQLRHRDVRVRLAAVQMLAARPEPAAAELRAGLRHSRFCESRLLGGATLAEAKTAQEGCDQEHLGAVWCSRHSARCPRCAP